MRFFKRKTDYKNQIDELEKSRQDLIKVNQRNFDLADDEINSTREFYEKMRSHGIKRFDHFLNLCLISSFTNTDVTLLCQQIRISKHKLEKLFYARMLALIIVEYLKDINVLLGFKLIGELNTNKYQEFVPKMKEINSDFAGIKKNHNTFLTEIRNKIAAHKTKEALNLVNSIYSLDVEKVFSLGLEIISMNVKLTNEGNRVYNKIIKEADLNKRNSK